MTRFDNEDQILEKARDKRLAGWGGWGRARVYNERGRDITITDGYWIIVMSENGWLGYIARFGLMCIPLILLGSEVQKARYDQSDIVIGHRLMHWHCRFAAQCNN